MSRKFLIALFSLFSSSLLAAPMNTDWVEIEWIDTRISGHHSINLTVSLPDTGETPPCTNLDRAVIEDSASSPIQGGEAMLNAALAALNGNKKVLLRVDGCALIHPTENTFTAPRVVRVSVCNGAVSGSTCNP